MAPLQQQQQAQNFTRNFGNARRACLRSCRNKQCSMTAFQNHGTCCTRCTGEVGPHAEDCALKNSKVCENQCGWTAFGGHATCCSSCKGGFGPHASDCALKNARVIVDRTRRPAAANPPPPQVAPTPQQEQRGKPRRQQPMQEQQQPMQQPVVDIVPQLGRPPQPALQLAQQGAGPCMAISVPLGWRPGDALQLPHPLIPNATITVMVPPTAVPGATILLPIPQGDEGQPSPVPSAPPQDGPVRGGLQQPGRKRKSDNEDKRGMGMAQAAAGAVGVVGGMVVAGALVGEAVQNGPAAAGVLIGEALDDGQAVADQVFGGEEANAAAGWANAAVDWLENLF